MPDQMNPSLGDLEDNSLGGILSRGLAADPTLGQTMPGLGAYAGHVLQGAGSMLGDIASKGPQLTKDVYEAGYSGQPISPGEMAPRSFDVVRDVTGLSSPFAVKGAVGAMGGKLTQSELANIAERAEARSAGAPVPPRVTAPAVTTPEGAAIKGRRFDAARKEVLEQLAKEPKGVGPMDLKAAEGLEGVEQKDIERYDPTEGRRKGVPPELEAALADPTVRAGVSQSIKDGIAMGAHKWYDTRAVRDAFRKAYAGSNSDPGGEKAFAHFMDLVAATSPRSDVGTNVRNATYYLGKLLRGEPLDEKAAYPYGHVAQKLHRQNFRNLSAAAAEGKPGWNPIQNPKPTTFSANLQGNLRGVTVDTHAFRNVVMRTRNPAFLAGQIRAKVDKTGRILEQEGEGELDEGAVAKSLLARFGERSVDKNGNMIVTIRPKQLFDQGRITMDEAVRLPSFWRSQPKKNEYAAVEKFWQELAKEHGLEPAEAQAAGWAGGGKLTGLGSPPAKTFAEIMNERAEYTARIRGADPTQTLYQALRGEVPLLGLGGLAAGAAAGAAAQPRPTAPPEGGI